MNEKQLQRDCRVLTTKAQSGKLLQQSITDMPRRKRDVSAFTLLERVLDSHSRPETGQSGFDEEGAGKIATQLIRSSLR